VGRSGSVLEHKSSRGCPVFQLPWSSIPDESSAILLRQQNTGAGLADALQSLDCDLEVANVEHRQLQLDVTCKQDSPQWLPGKPSYQLWIHLPSSDKQ